MEISALPWDCAVILAALAIVVPWRGTVRVHKLLATPQLETRDRMAIYGSTTAFQWIAAGITVWRTYVRGWSPASLGLSLRDPAMTIGMGTALALLVAILQFASLRQLSRTPAAQHGISYQMLRKLMPQSTVEVFPFVALVITVSVCEEFLYRGFVFAALARLFHDSAVVAVLGSTAIFAVGHLYQGRPGLITTFILGLIFAAMRVWTGSLVPCIIVHLVTDLVAGIAGPRMLQRSGSAHSAALPEA